MVLKLLVDVTVVHKWYKLLHLQPQKCTNTWPLRMEMRWQIALSGRIFCQYIALEAGVTPLCVSVMGTGWDHTEGQQVIKDNRLERTRTASRGFKPPVRPLTGSLMAVVDHLAQRRSHIQD